MTASAFATMLEARSVGAGKWQARCPAHPDRDPSLSIREGRDGRVLLNCFAGCSLSSVLKAMGLRLRDLFSGSLSSPEQYRGFAAERATRDAERRELKQKFRTACDRARKLETVFDSLAAKLALTPDDAPDGDALTRLFHSTLNRLRDAEEQSESLHEALCALAGKEPL